MAAASSPSPAELYSTMRASGNPAAAASVLDLYCATARGVATSADGCHGDVSSTPCCSPDARSGLSPVNLQSMSGSAALEATALRLMLAGGRQQLAPHHQGALPSLSLLGAGTSMHGSQQSAVHRHHTINETSAFYLPSVSEHVRLLSHHVYSYIYLHSFVDYFCQITNFNSFDKIIC